MAGRDKEADQQHMLLVVESAQRDGYSEREIHQIVEDAIEADAQLEGAA
jgi:hypothetical protein